MPAARPHRWWNIFSTRRFWRLFVGSHLVYVAIAFATADPQLIVVLNLAKVALASMVCVAFAPGVLAMMSTDDALDKESWLILGIFLSWFGSTYQGVFSLAWRYLGQPAWLVNSDIVSYPLFLICIAAVIHVAVPAVIQGRLPTAKGIRIGVMVGLAVFIGLLAVYWQDISTMVKHEGVSPGPYSEVDGPKRDAALPGVGAR